MKNIQNIQDKYIELFNKNKSVFPGKNIQWLNKIREEAIDQFSLYGFPDTSVEEWNVYPYMNLTNNFFPYKIKKSYNSDFLNIEKKDPNCLVRFIFNNGCMVKLEHEKLPKGIIVNSLKYFIDKSPEIIRGRINSDKKYFEKRLSNVLDARTQSVIALNTAFHEDGAVIIIEKDIEVPGYIEILNLDKHEKSYMSHVRSLICLDEGAKCNVIEKTVYSKSNNNLSFSSEVVDIKLLKNASLSMMRLIDGNLDNTNINSIHAEINENAVFDNSSFIFSKGEAREEIRVNLNGKNSMAKINGLILGLDSSKNELLTKVRHIDKESKSSQNVRIVLSDKARASFQGKIRVETNADKTIANMSGKSLLLNEVARVNLKPELEILADDVKCSHGVTVGNINKEQLFYLCSRGIPLKEAKNLLIGAFSNAIIENLPLIFKEKAKELVQKYNGL